MVIGGIKTGMDAFVSLISPAVLLGCVAIAFFAGMVKGVVGFAMPMIMVSGLGSLVTPELALGGLILPTLLTNGWQALRQGVGEALGSVWQFRLFLGVGLVGLVVSAQMVRFLDVPVMLLLIGGPVTVFVLLQLLGWTPRLQRRTAGVEAAVGGFAGLIGGFSGVWGPPTVLYLTALDTPKRDHIRIQGVIYGLGALALFFAHIASGVVRWQTVPFSILLCVPALAGMAMGVRLQDRIDQARFKRLTLIVLLIAALNLVRRGLIG